jgi:hypothetical protein
MERLGRIAAIAIITAILVAVIFAPLTAGLWK